MFKLSNSRTFVQTLGLQSSFNMIIHFGIKFAVKTKESLTLAPALSLRQRHGKTRIVSSLRKSPSGGTGKIYE